MAAHLSKTAWAEQEQKLRRGIEDEAVDPSAVKEVEERLERMLRNMARKLHNAGVEGYEDMVILLRCGKVDEELAKQDPARFEPLLSDCVRVALLVIEAYQVITPPPCVDALRAVLASIGLPAKARCEVYHLADLMGLLCERQVGAAFAVLSERWHEPFDPADAACMHRRLERAIDVTLTRRTGSVGEQSVESVGRRHTGRRRGSNRVCS